MASVCLREPELLQTAGETHWGSYGNGRVHLWTVRQCLRRHRAQSLDLAKCNTLMSPGILSCTRKETSGQTCTASLRQHSIARGICDVIGMVTAQQGLPSAQCY